MKHWPLEHMTHDEWEEAFGSIREEIGGSPSPYLR